MIEDNQGPSRPQEEKRSRKGAFILLALAAAAAGGIGYYSGVIGGNPVTGSAPQASQPPVAEQKTAETAPTQPAAAETQAPATAEPAEPAQPSETAQQQAAAAPAVTEVPKQEEPAANQTVVEPQAAPAQDNASAKAEVAPPPQPEPQPAPETQATQTTPAPQPSAAEQPAPAEATEEPAPAEATEEPTPAEATEQSAPAETQQAAVETQDQPEEQAPPAPAAAPEAAPSFDTVRVEATGDALIAGRAQPGADVRIKLNGNLIGVAKANNDGAFVFVPDKPLPAGAGSLTLETDLGGQVMASSNAVAVAVKEQAKGEALVAVVKPDAPVEVIQQPSNGDVEPSKQVVLDKVDYDSAGNIVFSGRSKPNSSVRIYVDNQLIGEVQANAEGSWTFNSKSLVVPGKHTLRADEVDGSGKVLSRMELPFLREESEKVAAVQTEASTADAATATEPGITATVGDSSAAVPQRIVIQPGNNLWRLSRLVYGRGTQFTVIYEANKDQIRDPDLIYPGQVFAVPLKQ